MALCKNKVRGQNKVRKQIQYCIRNKTLNFSTKQNEDEVNDVKSNLNLKEARFMPYSKSFPDSVYMIQVYKSAMRCKNVYLALQNFVSQAALASLAIAIRSIISVA